MPIAISLVVSSVVLFGGWFVYNSVAMENPLSDIVNNAPGVEQSQLNINSGEVSLKLKLAKDANLRDIYNKIATDGASIIGGRKLTIEALNESSPVLEEVWSQSLFHVAEAMETKQYSKIPQTLADIAKSNSKLQASTEMDDSNVYVSLSDGVHSKFVILPRTPEKIGVWPNE